MKKVECCRRFSFFKQHPFQIKNELSPYPLQEVYCQELEGGDVKIWIKDDQAYVLLNIIEAFIDDDKSHAENAEKILVDYFIRY